MTFLWRGLRLRCPKCGQAPIFRGWFSMNERCPACGRLFNRAPGYLLGSIYFNYGVTALFAIVIYLGVCIYYGEVQTGFGLKAFLVSFCVLFPMWFFRYARSLWIAFDERWDPWPNDQEAREAGLAPTRGDLLN
jgi:uncharacterized protein (DUF983 family)